MNRGFTLLELLVSIAILTILSLTGAWYWSSATTEQALEKDRQGLISLLSEARSLSLSSKDAARYGVHLEEARAVLFKGNSYVAGSSDNIPYEYNRLVHMDSHSLSGGGSDILFSRLKGETSNYGTIRLSLINDSLSSTTIIVGSTGVIE